MPTSAALLGANDDVGDVGSLVATAASGASHHHNHHHLGHHHPHIGSHSSGHSFGSLVKFEHQQQPSIVTSAASSASVMGTVSELALLGTTAQNDPSFPQLCDACDGKITDLFYMAAAGKAWHIHCLRCTACRETLNEGSCFWKSGDIYCRKDYHRLFCRCAGCCDEIGPYDLIMPVVDRGDCSGRVSCLLFHLACFKCRMCNRRLERGAQFFTQGTHVYCEQHFDICTSSSPMLLPMAPLQQTPRLDDLEGPSAYVFGGSNDIMDCEIGSNGAPLNGNNSNKAANNRRNGGGSKTQKPGARKNTATKTNPSQQQQLQQQQQQQQPISPSSLHQTVPLSSSSPRNVCDSIVVAPQDNAVLVPQPQLYKSRTPPPQLSQLSQHPPPLIHRHTHQGLLSTVPAAHHLAPATGDLGAADGFLSGADSVTADYYGAPTAGGSAADFLNGGGDGQPSGASNGQQQPVPQQSSTQQQGHSGSSHSASGSGSQQRGKRIRTSFKHTQLKIMKHYFSENHNPDAKDLKQLSIKTGLSKRVLQVWFQNARAKFRRTLLKEQQKQGGSAASMLANGQLGFLGGNSSMSDRAQSTSLLEGDSPMSNNSGNGDGVTGMSGISSTSMTMGGDDDCLYDKDDELDDGFQDADDASTSDRRSRNGMAMANNNNGGATSKSPASMMGRHLSPPHGILLPGDQHHLNAMTPPANKYLDSSSGIFTSGIFASSPASGPMGAGEFSLGQIIQPSML